MDIFDKEALGIRGRFGVDVWERWLTFQHSQEDFLRNYGVREDRIDGTILALKRLLGDEGIMADRDYHRANRKTANDLFDRLFSSPGVFSVGSSGDIMAYVDLPSDEIPNGGTHFYWVVIDSNGDEIVGGASSSFEEAKSLAENNLFRLSRELYPESYTSHKANRKVAWQMWSLESYTDEDLLQSKKELEENIEMTKEWREKAYDRLETETSMLEKNYISEDILGYADSIYGDEIHIQQIEEEMRARGIHTSHNANRKTAYSGGEMGWENVADGGDPIYGSSGEGPDGFYYSYYVYANDVNLVFEAQNEDTLDPEEAWTFEHGGDIPSGDRLVALGDAMAIEFMEAGGVSNPLGKVSHNANLKVSYSKEDEFEVHDEVVEKFPGGEGALAELFGYTNQDQAEANSAKVMPYIEDAVFSRGGDQDDVDFAYDNLEYHFQTEY